MKTKIVAFGLISLVSSFSWAGYEVGNGGGGIVCGDQSRVQLLDYTSLIVPTQVHLQYSQAATWPEKVADLLARIRSKNPARVELYSNWLGNFLSETHFLKSAHLNPSTDVGLVPIPAGCTYVQIAGQFEPDSSLPFRYVIDQSLWDKMDEDAKAGLVLHELIWREVRHQTLPHADGRYVREFTSWVTSAEIEPLKLSDYIELLLRLHFEMAQVQNGIQIRLSEPPVFIDSSRVRRAAVISQFISLPWLQEARLSTETLQIYLPDQNSFEFLEDGTPAEFDIVGLNTVVADPKPTLSITIMKGPFIAVVGVEKTSDSVLHVQSTNINGEMTVAFTPKILFSNGNKLPAFTATVMTPIRHDCYRNVKINITQASLLKCDEF